jgi:hypothetical protein
MEVGTGLYHHPLERYKAKGTSIEYVKRHVPLNGDVLALNRGQ